jgi:peptide chain release factor 1
MEQKIATLRAELAELQNRLSDPAIFSTPEYPKLAKRQRYLESTITTYDTVTDLRQQLDQAQELAGAGGELAELAEIEITELNEKLTHATTTLDEALTPKDPNDERDCIIEIRGGAGGDESALFGAELYRMYVRYAELHNFIVELINESPSESGGFKEIVFAVRGDDAYKTYKFEAGVHRVQRVPVTESQGRIHTSTVTVAVYQKQRKQIFRLTLTTYV